MLAGLGGDDSTVLLAELLLTLDILVVATQRLLTEGRTDGWAKEAAQLPLVVRLELRLNLGLLSLEVKRELLHILVHLALQT